MCFVSSSHTQIHIVIVSRVVSIIHNMNIPRQYMDVCVYNTATAPFHLIFLSSSTSSYSCSFELFFVFDSVLFIRKVDYLFFVVLVSTECIFCVCIKCVFVCENEWSERKRKEEKRELKREENVCDFYTWHMCCAAAHQ